MSTIYVLSLEQGKYYVGETTDLDHRLAQHFAGQGSYWTQKHSAVRLIKTIPKENMHTENNLTKELMARYGIENVRGVLQSSYLG